VQFLARVGPKHRVFEGKLLTRAVAGSRRRSREPGRAGYEFSRHNG
jgi:hypothetical protein